MDGVSKHCTLSPKTVRFDLSPQLGPLKATDKKLSCPRLVLMTSDVKRGSTGNVCFNRGAVSLRENTLIILQNPKKKEKKLYIPRQSAFLWVG